MAQRWHVAILKRHYLDLLLEGSKRIESRFTRNSCAPFKAVAPGETVLLKESGGPIRGRAEVERVEFYENLTPARVRRLQQRYNGLILGEETYWQAKASSRYASLIWLTKVELLKPYRIAHRGMQAWLIGEGPHEPSK